MNLIAVWGSSGAGKTTVALAVAAALAKKSDVLVISTENRTPALPVYLPKTDFVPNQSIGGLLDAPAISEASLKDRLHQHPKSSRLFFSGYVSKELPGITKTNLPVSQEAALSLLQVLTQTPFSHIIVDCDSNPAYDALTLLSLEHAQTVIRVITPDVKGYEFMKAQLAWMSGSTRLNVDRHIKIANLVFRHSPLSDAEMASGGFDFVLPYADQAAKRMAAGQLLRDFNDGPSIRFEHQIDALVARISEGGADDAE